MRFPKFKTKDEIPESMRDAYVERNGEWVPDIEDVSGLKSAQQRALDEKKKLEEQMRALTGDRKPEEVAAILKRHKELEDEQAKKAGDFDKLLEKRLAERDAEWQKKYDAVAPYKGKYEDREIETAIRKAALAAGVDAKDLEEYVIPLTKGRRVKLDDAGKVVVLDKDGDATGLTVEKFFTDTFKAEAPKFYGASGGSGGGAAPGSGGSRGAAGTVDRTDNAGFLANLDKIEKGEVKVA